MIIPYNEFTLKDSFEIVNWIQDTPSSLFVNEYKYLSFDVKPLFTNVPIKKTIDVILTSLIISFSFYYTI